MVDSRDDVLSISNKKYQEYPVIPSGVYEVEFTGWKPFDNPNSAWGPEKGVMFMLKICSGPMAGNMLFFRAKFYRDKNSGEFYIGSKSRLGDAIRAVSNGGGTLSRQHVGTRVFASVETVQSKKNAASYFTNVKNLMPLPSGYGVNNAGAPVYNTSAPTNNTGPQQTYPYPQQNVVYGQQGPVNHYQPQQPVSYPQPQGAMHSPPPQQQMPVRQDNSALTPPQQCAAPTYTPPPASTNVNGLASAEELDGDDEHTGGGIDEVPF